MTPPFNFHEVTGLPPQAGRLYRSGQPLDAAEWDFLKAQGIQDVLKLNTQSQGIDAMACEHRDMVLHLVHLSDAAPDPNRSHLEYAHALVVHALAAGRSILVHCFGGVDRTGITVARYRVSHCGWPKLHAFEEWIRMGSNRYKGLEEAWHDWEPKGT